MMDFFTEDLWSIILARLPLKTMATSKLVCKQWKSILESPFLQEIFLSHHQNSHPSWSLMRRDAPEKVVAHYGCEVWGLPRSLGSYYTVLAYTDIGLILLHVRTLFVDETYYVANPITKQRIKIPPPSEDLLGFAETTEELGFVDSYFFLRQASLVAQTENGVVLGYKVVLTGTRFRDTGCFIVFLMYSSETGTWSYKTLQSSLPLVSSYHCDSISLNGNLYWLGNNLVSQDVLVSYDFYGSENQCRVIPFPDSEEEKPNFKRSCTASEGNLMYMNITSQYKDDGSLENKLRVWRLKNGSEWQLVSETSPAFIKTGTDYIPLVINPFDANTVYLWSEMDKSLVSLNLRNGNLELHNELERSSNGQTLSSFRCIKEMNTMECLSNSYFSFVLPRWLYRIPRRQH
ncbi:unnamed protein product [Microthlaspi erraticum]|uniref:F-box domain-containing protein n=1 Tax=Microthlaspi erraticum TaxID=1685480 RepID=A0A6D2IZH5_9BRAS|nr:unnamed protein product [Microthlaspi erraticum]